MTNALYFDRKTEKFSGFSSFTLKIIAITAMLCDHASVVFLGMSVTPLRIIGRIAFPVFAFMIAEGARRTHSVKKYILRLLIFAFISEVPFDIALFGHAVYLGAQNVFFTLLLGLLAIRFYQIFSEKGCGFVGILTLIVCMFFAELVLFADYGASGVLSVFLFYVFANKKMPYRFLGYLLSALILCITLPHISILESEIFAVFGLIPILLYNGEKGMNINKYVFYGFYPAHLLVLFLINFLINLK